MRLALVSRVRLGRALVMTGARRLVSRFRATTQAYDQGAEPRPGPAADNQRQSILWSSEFADAVGHPLALRP